MNKGTKILANNFIYDKVGNPLSITYGNGLTQQWEYDIKNRISTIYILNILNLNYTYDPVDNITAITNNLEPFKSKAYNYDPLDRLINATGSWGNLAWTYDANGNRLRQSNGINTAYTYQANRLMSVTSDYIYNYQYDNNRNTTRDGLREFVYNQNNRMIKAIENSKTLGEYVYNGKGQRVIKKIGPAATNSASGQNTIYHYDLSGRLIEETSGNGKLLIDYVYLSGQPLAMIRKQGNNEETFYYHNDHLGTPKVMTDKLAKVVWNVEFDPFGNEIEQRGRRSSYIRSVENNFRFPGQYYDAESGLHQNGFRDYNPSTGMYLQPDPIGLDGGINLYSYGNNPVKYIDPLGLYDRDVHYDLTLALAVKAGIEFRIAERIAAANQRIDDGLFTNPTLWPINLLLGGSFHFQTQQYAHVGLNQALERGDIDQFGKFLHILQDAYSHEGYSLLFMGHFLDSVLFGKNPDEYKCENDRDIRMKQETMRWLNAFEERIGEKYHPVLRRTR